MLTTHLNNVPLSKFVLIEDCLEQPNYNLLRVLIATHRKYGKLLYYTFEGVFKAIPNASTTYDCVSNCNGWLSKPRSDFKEHIKEITADSIVVIDSLIHAVMQYGFSSMYKILKELMDSTEVLRIITVFHTDLDSSTLRFFQHLATIHITLHPKNRLSYVYKKNRKVVAQTETYRIEHDLLKCEKIKPIETKTLLENLNPEELSTFRISLNENEKELRSKVVLPYLPKEDGQIFYEFDQVDDWDEEDPDDDLDI